MICSRHQESRAEQACTRDKHVNVTHVADRHVEKQKAAKETRQQSVLIEATGLLVYRSRIPSLSFRADFSNVQICCLSFTWLRIYSKGIACKPSKGSSPKL
eukprot:1354526-Pleurochrysis_carterae.AAC.2